MLLSTIATTSRQVAATRSRLQKIEHLRGCLQRAAPHEIGIAVDYLSGHLPQGRIGIGPAALRDAVPEPARGAPTLSLQQVDEAVARIIAATGAGSQAERRRLLSGLLHEATPEEQAFLIRLLVGELRQGALEGIMVEAIARAAGLPATDVRRAVMLAGDPAAVARAALAGGAAGLGRFSLELLKPVKPMLAQPADSIAAALERLGSAGLEFKMDGARVQVHKLGDEVRVFTRRLKDVTAAVPEIVTAVSDLPARALILDGETLAMRADGTPLPFQTTMRRFGRKLDVARMREELPLSAFFFDCLHLDGEDLIDRPGHERFASLEQALPAEFRVPRRVCEDPAEAEAFLDEALQRGHEGLMAKSLEASYEAGNRGSSWLKVKPVHSLDLVVLAAEWGHGRRRGWLSNLHLGARDCVSGQFVMLGKTFKGMTDEMLAWQTKRLQELELTRDAHTVYVRPELVVEVVFNDIQASPHYPGGLALRFARIRNYRPDKKAVDADTIETVREIHAGR